jgi:hypothetical protein
LPIEWIPDRPEPEPSVLLLTLEAASADAELLQLERELGDYVIVHELLNFSVPNYGKLWKSRMHPGSGCHVENARSVLVLP